MSSQWGRVWPEQRGQSTGKPRKDPVIQMRPLFQSTTSFVDASWAIIQFLCVLCIVIGFIIVGYGLYHHTMMTYNEMSQIIEKQHHQAQELRDGFCLTDKANRMEYEECQKAEAVLRRNPVLEAWEKTWEESLDHLPYMHYCRHNNCRDFVIYAFDTIRNPSLLGSVVMITSLVVFWYLLYCCCARTAYQTTRSWWQGETCEILPIPGACQNNHERLRDHTADYAAPVSEDSRGEGEPLIINRQKKKSPYQDYGDFGSIGV